MIGPISCCILSYNRAQNLPYIVDKYSKYALFDDIIIWHGNPKVRLESIRQATIIQVSEARPKSVHDRFMAAAAASCPTIFFNDDDIVCGEKIIRTLIDSFENKPNVIHSVIGMRPNGSGSLSGHRGASDTAVPLLGAAIVSRDYCVDYLKKINEYKNIEGSEHAEDIIFSHQVHKSVGQYHRLVDADISDIIKLGGDENFALKNQPGFRENRDTIYAKLYYGH